MAPRRPLRALYLLFFLTHIPVMLLVDLHPFWPPSLRPPLLDRIRAYYVDTYRDRFFAPAPAPWFRFYLAMEALYHLPLSVWMVGALLRDHPLVPLHLLVFALQAGLTTSTCIFEMLSWPELSAAEKGRLGWLYGPYLALATLMGADAFLQVRKTLLSTPLSSSSPSSGGAGRRAQAVKKGQ